MLKCIFRNYSFSPYGRSFLIKVKCMYEARVEYLEEKEKRFEQKIMYGGMDILWNNTI